MNGEHGLIDLDLWTYDIPFAAQRKQPDGTVEIFDFEYCKNLFYKRIEEVMKMAQIKTWEGFLTGTGNFRHELAKNLPYKGNRKQPRPWHYENMRLWLEHVQGAKVVDGMEADDALSIRQLELGEASCIVSRDKDLRMVPGWHFGYSCGKQRTFGPVLYDQIGELMLEGRGIKQKIRGGGLKFFYSQLITGDSTDNIQGLPGGGDVLAFNTLSDCYDEEEMFQRVWNLFYRKYQDSDRATERMLEDGQLLWMCRELHKDGSPVMWTFPFNPEVRETNNEDASVLPNTA